MFGTTSRVGMQGLCCSGKEKVVLRLYDVRFEAMEDIEGMGSVVFTKFVGDGGDVIQSERGRAWTQPV